MNVAILFSGGKDSTMALYQAIENLDDVKCLLSIKSSNDESYMFHVPNINMADMISEAVDIPLITQYTTGIKEKELEDLKTSFLKIKKLGIEGVYTGALYSTYQKSRIEKIADEIGLKVISPFWHVNVLDYMKKIVNLGFEFIICGVYAYGLDESWLGRKIDLEAILELEKIHEEYRINIAFEGGEAETLVLDGPIFKKKIEILKAEKEWNIDSGVYNILEAKLTEK